MESGFFRRNDEFHGHFPFAKDLEGLLQIDRKTIYAYVQKGLIPHSRIESNVRFPKHRIQRWLEERSFQPRPVNGNGAKRQ